MAELQNPFPEIAEAAQAAGRILSLQKDLFIVKQELKAIRHVKKVLWLTTSLISLCFMIALGSLWVGLGLHENGWSYFQLALLSLGIFGGLTAVTALIAMRTVK